MAIRVERGVSVTMRDGTVLRADVYRPDAEGTYPVLVERSPYELIGRAGPHGDYFANHGYVFVTQNVRGTYASGGEFRFGDDDGWGLHRDGFDSIEWAAQQPWSNGMIGTLGGSYSGYTQYALAPTRPPHLRAMFVRQAPSDIYQDSFRHGANELWLGRDWVLRAYLLPKVQGSPRQAAIERAASEVESWCRHLPVNALPPVEGLADWHLQMLEHREDGPYWWNRNTLLKLGEADVPIFHLTGWFDIFLQSTLRAFQCVRRSPQRLIIGPWIHGPSNIGVSQVGELDFGAEAKLEFDELRRRWFDHWLKDADNGVPDDPRIRVFVMGSNRWMNLDEWPPSDSAATRLYFRQGAGRDGTSLNNGRLTFSPPDQAEHPDSFVYDPMDPLPSLLLYPQLGPRDHASLEGRMLTYTSDALERDLTVVGPVTAVLHGMSSARDTDWIVRVCDVWPDGRSMSVCDGVLRARYRDSSERPGLLQPDQVHRFEIDLWATAQVFRAGHRVRVQVTSSDFPRYDRNLNTGGQIGQEVYAEVALNTVFHDTLRPSHLVLPVLGGLSS